MEWSKYQLGLGIELSYSTIPDRLPRCYHYNYTNQSQTMNAVGANLSIYFEFHL